MQQILDHSVDMNHYEADAGIIWCFDARFSGSLYHEFVSHAGLAYVDPIIIAGGGKNLVDPASDAYAYVLNQVMISVKLHSTKQFYVMVHHDCGAYGAVDDPETFFVAEAKKAAANLADALKEAGYGQVAVSPLVAKADGVYMV